MPGRPEVCEHARRSRTPVDVEVLAAGDPGGDALLAG